MYQFEVVKKSKLYEKRNETFNFKRKETLKCKRPLSNHRAQIAADCEDLRETSNIGKILVHSCILKHNRICLVKIILEGIKFTQ